MSRQSALGEMRENRFPSFSKTDIGRVTKNHEYEKYGIIEVVLLDHSKPFPVWIVGDIDRKPMKGDHVVIGYISGRKDAPYLVGHMKNKSYTTNFIKMDEKHIRIQLPALQVGQKDGIAHNDTKEFLNNPSKLPQRGFVDIWEHNDGKAGVTISYPRTQSSDTENSYIRVSPDDIELSFPTGKSPLGANPRAKIVMNDGSIAINHPTGSVTITTPKGTSTF